MVSLFSLASVLSTSIHQLFSHEEHSLDAKMTSTFFQRLHQILTFSNSLWWWLCPSELMFLCVPLIYLTSSSPHQMATDLAQWSPELCLSIGAWNFSLCLAGCPTILTSPTAPFINSPEANILQHWRHPTLYIDMPGSLELSWWQYITTTLEASNTVHRHAGKPRAVLMAIYYHNTGGINTGHRHAGKPRAVLMAIYYHNTGGIQHWT